MGQARQRGTRDQRIAEAVAADRLKPDAVRPADITDTLPSLFEVAAIQRAAASIAAMRQLDTAAAKAKQFVVARRRAAQMVIRGKRERALAAAEALSATAAATAMPPDPQ